MTATVRGIAATGRGGSINIEGQREYTVTYYVQTDNKLDGPAEVRTAFGVPSVGDIYIAGNDLDGAAIVVGKEVSQNDDCPFEWEVQVSYSTQPPDEPWGISLADNPLGQPAEISYGFRQRRILVPGQYNDPLGPPNDHAWQQGIFAPNGELFNPQPEVDISEPVLTIKRNVSAATWASLQPMSLADVVNSDWYMDCEPRQLKLDAPTANRKWHKLVGFYWEVQYAIAYRWNTWDLQLLNQGTYFFENGKPLTVWSTTLNRKTKTDVQGNVLTVNLSTNGKVNETGTPTFTRIRFYRERPFAPLNLV